VNSFLVTAACSYLLGSIPFGYILVRMFRGQDVRKTGSGNIGATNVSRTSPALGALTLILDALKGFAAVALARAWYPDQKMLLGLAAFMAIAGHVFPVWLKFKGGKGVATGFGAFLLVAPTTVLLMIVVFAMVAGLSRQVSLASIVTVAFFPLAAWILNSDSDTPQMLACMAAASVLIIAKHHGNIRRLLAGTEPRMRWRRR
jgi:acyl phosphate:glycerol-3-phosphate acyltransferase